MASSPHNQPATEQVPEEEATERPLRPSSEHDTQRALFATAPHGVARLLANELEELGATDVTVAGAGVRFHASPETMYRVCLWSRLANRILLPVLRGKADSEDALYKLVQSVDWSEHMAVGNTLAVDFFSSQSAVSHTLYGAQKVKDAIVDQFREATGERPSVERETPDLRINVYLHRDNARIALDMSGSSLHRRGYREQSTRAPLKENLAAAMLAASGWPAMAARGQSLFDPMCGSGTLLIEAALMASDSAPGLARDYYGFLGWAGHDDELWQSVLRDAKARSAKGRDKLIKSGVKILGADRDRRVLESCNSNLQAAEVESLVQVQQQDFFTDKNRPFADQPDSGLLVFNPPYGERLATGNSASTFYRDINKRLRSSFHQWQIGILTPADAPAHMLRLKSNAQDEKRGDDKKKKGGNNKPNKNLSAGLSFSNGGIDCRYLTGMVSGGSAGTAASVWSAGTAAETTVDTTPETTPITTAPGSDRRNPWDKNKSENKNKTTKEEPAALKATAGTQPSMFRNRLAKNRKKIKSWLKQNEIRAYRLYDADMPEYAVAIDVYEIEHPDSPEHLQTRAVVQEYRAPASVDAGKARERLQQVLSDTVAELDLQPEHLHLKVRERQKGSSQYEKGHDTQAFFRITEYGCRVLVNFDDYLDTGLFVDSRKIRHYIQQQAKGKRFLNLFSYTGCATMHAIAGGAALTTSVDSSRTYLNWADKNLKLNTGSYQNDGSDTSNQHQMVRADAMTWLASDKESTEKYDLILLDPPTFSNSRDLEADWDVQKNHAESIQQCMKRLSPDGLLIFVTNYKRFRFEEDKLSGIKAENRSSWSIDRDFTRNQKIHQCWFIQHA